DPSPQRDGWFPKKDEASPQKDGASVGERLELGRLSPRPGHGRILSVHSNPDQIARAETAPQGRSFMIQSPPRRVFRQTVALRLGLGILFLLTAGVFLAAGLSSNPVDPRGIVIGILILGAYAAL